MNRLRLLVADPWDMVCTGMKQSFAAYPEIKFITAASDAEDLLLKLRLHSPDVVLMSIELPGMRILELCVRIRQEHPGMGIVLLATAAPKNIYGLVTLGVFGMQHRSAGAGRLVQCIRSVHKGEMDVNGFSKDLSTAMDMRLQMPRFNALQLAIIPLWAEHTAKEIGLILHRSFYTIEDNCKQMRKKTQTRSKEEFLDWARNVGIVD